MYALQKPSGLSVSAPKAKAQTARSVVARAVGSEINQLDRKAFLKSLPGVSAPFENVFDPLSFSATARNVDIRRWRESEITHGRVAMLATVGFIVGENLEDFPAFFNFDGHITGPALNHFNMVGQGFWEPLLVFIGLAESYRVNIGWAVPKGSGFNQLRDDYEPGNLGFDPLNILKDATAEQIKDMQTKELNNGRLAMIAIAGFVVQEVTHPGTDLFDHLFYYIEKEAIEELDDIERDIGLPLTPVPALPTLPVS